MRARAKLLSRTDHVARRQPVPEHVEVDVGVRGSGDGVRAVELTSTSSAATSAARSCSATAETSVSAVTVTCGPIPGARCSILRRNWQSTSFGRSCGTRPTTRANSAE